MCIDDERDETLVGRVLAGNAAAYAPLVRRYRRASLARALAVGGDTFDAEDVAQDAFVQTYEQLATLRDPARFGPWLLTIVHRRALNVLRAEKRRRAAPLTHALTDSGVTADVRAAHESRDALLAAMERLSQAQRVVVLLADLEGWSHERIAEAVGCSIVMSRRHLSDARRLLRAILSEKEGR